MISDSIVLDLALGPTVLPVLERTAAAIGSQADIDLDRLGDLDVVVSTLSQSAHRFSVDGRLRFALQPEPRTVVVRVGPLKVGGAEGLRTASIVPGVGPILEQLTDGVRTDTGPDGEYLTVIVSSNGRDPAS